MRKSLLAFALLFCSFSYGQIISPNAFGIIDTNNFAAGFNSSGDLFNKDTVDSHGTYTLIPQSRVPKAGQSNAIFISSIWVAGMSHDSLFNSSATYENNYRPGPAGLMPQDSVSWKKIWAISRMDVLSVKNDFDSNHTITRPIPATVLGWPAKGNANAVGNNGVALTINQDMAPFVDRNGDGIYNVYDGDYPLVRGDQMLWWINNDWGSQSQNPMGIDRRYSVYEYECAGDSNLDNTLFLSVSIKNQSNRVYDSVTIGAYTDMPLGCANDNHTGSIPSLNSFYVYKGFVFGATSQNGVTCDEGSVCPTSEVGYGCRLPIISATFLNNTMKCYEYFTNGSSNAQATPNTDQQYYQYMNGQWNDGTPVTYGGTAYGGTTPYPFAFSGNPADISQWSEVNPHFGTIIDAGARYSAAAIGPFSLGVGDTMSFDMAFIFHQDSFNNAPDISDSSIVNRHIDSISRYYASETFPCWFDSSKLLTPGYINVGIHEIATGPEFSLVPNPNNGSFNIHMSNTGFSDYSLSVTDMLGRIVYYDPNAHAPDQTVRMGDVTNGVYSVTIETQNYKATRKVVVTAQ